MPDAKLTDLPSVVTPASSDKLYIVDNNLSKNISVGDFALNLPDILTTGNASVSGNIKLASASTIILDNEDYSVYVNDQIKTNFTPITGTGLTVQTGTTDYEVTSATSNTVIALSADTSASDRIKIKVANQGNFSGYNLSFIQLGTSILELSAGTGVTIGSLNNSLSSAGQYSKLDLTYIQNQIYTLTGDLSTAP